MMRPRLVRALVQRALTGNKGALRLLARHILPLIDARVRQWAGNHGVVDDGEIDRMVHDAWLAVLADPRLPHTQALESVVLAVCDTWLGVRLADAERRARRTPADPALAPLLAHLEAALDTDTLLAFRLLYTDGCKPALVARLLDTDEAQVLAWQATIRDAAAAWTARAQGDAP